MIYHGKSFDDILNVVEVSRPSMNREYKTVDNRRGEILTTLSDSLQEITVTAWIRKGPNTNYKSVRQLRDELLYYLTLEDDDDQLIFSDQPDRYYNAKFSGSINPEYINQNDAKIEITFSCKDGFAHSLEKKIFKPTEKESGELLVDVFNQGTVKSPLDIRVNFLEDVDSVGIASKNSTVQFGTTISEDEEEDFVPSEKIVSDPMDSKQKKAWEENIARPRWRNGDGDNASKVMGSLNWNDKESGVYVKSWGTIDKDKPGYWHGPSVTRFFNDPLANFDCYHRFNFKPINGRYGKKGAQGLLEINYADADSNYVIGFEMKDNTDKKEEITYRFFVGTTPIYQGKLPSNIAKEGGGFFGSVGLKKVGNQFTFKLARLRGTPFKETWSIEKSFTNETVAMLSADRVDCWMSQWKNFTAMRLGITHSRMTKINTEEDSLVPLTFYSGDELFAEGATNRVYINGIRSDDYRVIGSSQFLEAAIGREEFSIISDGKIDGNMELREMYL